MISDSLEFKEAFDIVISWNSCGETSKPYTSIRKSEVEVEKTNVPAFRLQLPTLLCNLEVNLARPAVFHITFIECFTIICFPCLLG